MHTWYTENTLADKKVWEYNYVILVLEFPQYKYWRHSLHNARDTEPFLQVCNPLP